MMSKEMVGRRKRLPRNVALRNSLRTIRRTDVINRRLDPELFQIRASQRFLESLHGGRLNQIHGAAPESATGHPGAQRALDLHRAMHRSEERRVGKECRAR